MPPVLIGLAVGAAQAIGNEQKEAGQRYLAANTARLSPWTHMTPNAIQAANPVGDLASGAMAGLQYGQQNPSNPTQATGDVLNNAADQGGVTGGAGAMGAGAGAGAGMLYSGSNELPGEAATAESTPGGPPPTPIQQAASLNPLQSLQKKWGLGKDFSPYDYMQRKNNG